jgi:MinD-like ATPase involved in chromosome partitioning or flagellar assembly
VTVDVARRLDVPHLFHVLNKIPSNVDVDDLREQMTAAYGAETAGFLPLAEEVVENASGGLFSLTSPDHPWSQEIGKIVARIQAN